MNRYLTSFCLCVMMVCAGFLASCSDDDEPGNGLRLTGDTKTEQIVFADQTSGSQGISFYAPAAWTATVTDITGSRADANTPDWLTLSSYKGETGEHTITLTIAPNTTGRDRKARIVIDCEGSRITIVIEQRGDRAEGSVVKPVKEIVYAENVGEFEGMRFSSDYTMTFAYDEEDRVVRVVTTFKEIFGDDVYRADLDYRIAGEIAATVSHPGADVADGKYTLKLNSDGNVLKVTDNSMSAADNTLLSFKYDGSGRIVACDEYDYGSLDSQNAFSYADGVLARMAFKTRYDSTEVVNFTLADNYPNRYPNSCRIDMLSLLRAYGDSYDHEDYDFVYSIGRTGRSGDCLLEVIPNEPDDLSYGIPTESDTPDMTVHKTFREYAYTADVRRLEYTFDKDGNLKTIKSRQPYDIVQIDYDIVSGSENVGTPEYPRYECHMENWKREKVGSSTHVCSYTIRY